MVWYKDGLRFKCLNNCSNCCTGAPGFVYLTDGEIENISNFFKISKKSFLTKYTRQVRNGISLKENYKNFDCCFLKDKKCLIYTQRPKQCKTFPWWKNNLKTTQAWQNSKKDCPGLDHVDGKLYSFQEIQKNLSDEDLL
ncbi:MAG: hypothetical protein K940chlam1_00549 [Candidatus Anoxychlamydiales bacterium]|nr:hypothetical protein [Candidatus Anoxychlamydiales bacterium]NGX36150.1 hypothetical protein [Candidatus Anoxychlamydiales bacterium]